MYRSNTSRFVPIILIAIAVVVVVIILIIVGRGIFAGQTGSGINSKAQQEASESGLLTLDVNRSVEMFVRGPIVADENFQSYSIVVSPESRVYRTYSGYSDKIVSEKSYANTMQAYEQFVYALDKANFTQPGKQSKAADADDTRGICATGQLTQFTLKDGGDNTYQAWTSDCSGSPGTFGASLSQVSNLFTNQIPSLVNNSSAQLSLRSL